MEIDPSNLSGEQCYRLMSDVIVPRPIAWISTAGLNGVFNLAPFSFFGVISVDPPMVAIAVGWRRGQKKDTIKNAEDIGDFVVNVVSEDLTEAMNLTSADLPADESEFELAGLTPVPSKVVRSPRVGEAPISVECRVVRVTEIGKLPRMTSLIVGEIVFFHVRDDLYRMGRIDLEALRAVGRLSGDAYCNTTGMFELKRPR